VNALSILGKNKKATERDRFNDKSMNHNEDVAGLTQEKLTLNDTLVEETEASPMSQQQRGIFASFLKQLASSRGDLHSISCPAFLISGISLLEYVVNWLDFPDVFARIESAKTPEGKRSYEEENDGIKN
jgi:hypothetical protein